MRPSTGEMEFVSSYPINQEPIRFDVRVTIALPVPFQRVIFAARRQFFFGDEQL
jgi:hypothetical protein